jgi:hypothetical protein
VLGPADLRGGVEADRNLIGSGGGRARRTAGRSSARSSLVRDDNERQERANTKPNSRSLKASAHDAVRDDNVKKEKKEKGQAKRTAKEKAKRTAGPSSAKSASLGMTT